MIHIDWSAKLGLLAVAFVVGSGAACGGGGMQPGAPTAGGSGGSADGGGSGAGAAGSDGSDAAGAGPRPVACGGTVQATGSTPSGSFEAHYLYASLLGGDCAAGLVIAIAETDRLDSEVFVIHPFPISNGSYLGTSTRPASYQTTSGMAPGAIDLSATVTVTAFPDPPPTSGSDLNDGGSGLVSGSFSIEAPGISLAGTFSTPICGFIICV